MAQKNERPDAMDQKDQEGVGLQRRLYICLLVFNRAKSIMAKVDELAVVILLLRSQSKCLVPFIICGGELTKEVSYNKTIHNKKPLLTLLYRSAVHTSKYPLNPSIH